MKLSAKSWCFLIVVLASVGHANASFANDIYIAQAATGANSGSSCANARAYSFFNTASNWGTGASQIGPGTTVHICGTITGPQASSCWHFKVAERAAVQSRCLFESGAIVQAPYFPPSVGGMNLWRRNLWTGSKLKL